MAAAIFAVPQGAAQTTAIGYSYTGRTQTYTVPAGIDYITIKAWGAGGGGGANTFGGGGAFATARYYVSTGQLFTISVAGGGTGLGGWPGGGNSCQAATGGGGGVTIVATPSGTVYAAGGGGGGNGVWYVSNGGAGGGTIGQNGATHSGGYGATQTSGGAGGPGDAGNGSAGSFSAGGNGMIPYGGCFAGGGGGAGYYGGGGGGNSTEWTSDGSTGGGGGAGGSSYATGSATNVSYTAGSNQTAGGTSDSNYPGGDIGYGAPNLSNASYNGYVVLLVHTGAPTITSPLAATYDEGQSVSYTITGTGTPTSFGATNLPPGFTLNTSTGAITGTATTPGSYNSTISATNSSGTGSATVTWTIVAYSIAPAGSVSPNSIFVTQSVTLDRAGSANFGIDWTQNTVWTPSGSPEVLGNYYSPNALGTMTYTPDAGPGTYSWQFRIVDIYYNFQDQWITFTVNADQVYPPTSVQPSVVGSTFVTFSWSGASATVGVASYNIYRNGAYLANTTATSFTDSTVSPLGNYNYTIVSVDTRGNTSAVSSPMGVTTVADFEVFTPIP